MDSMPIALASSSSPKLAVTYRNPADRSLNEVDIADKILHMVWGVI
jgi:hypothetical protein